MSDRTRYVLTRIGLSIPVLLLMSMIVFLVIHLIPGDPAKVILGLQATPSAIAQIRSDLHLDDSLPQQYLYWITGVMHGDLGVDYKNGQSVIGAIGGALPATLELAVLSLTFAVVVAVPVGVAAATGTPWARRCTEVFVIAGTAVPDFWLGIMLTLLFTTVLGLLPPFGYVDFTSNPSENLRYYILPVLTLGVGQAAYLARITRGAVEDALRAPYVTFLRAKGLPERWVIRHVLRNAAAPIVTVIGTLFGLLLGGAIVIETLFGLPGVGHLIVQAIQTRNYTVVQGGVLTIATLFILVNLVTDLALARIDPRVGEAVAR